MIKKISDVAEIVAGFAFKSKDFGDNYPDKVIKITHIVPPSVDMDGLSTVDMSQYDRKKLEKYMARKGDYVFAMTGATIGKIGRIEKGEAYLNQRVMMFKPHSEIDKDFLYYILTQKNFYQYVLNHIDSDSAQPNISAGTVGKYEFDMPDLETQKRIGAILRQYDEKIENNRLINDNLLQQALCLYSSLISESAKNGYIGDYCSIKSGFAFKSKWWQDSGVPVVKIGSINQDYLNLSDCSYVSDDKIPFANDFIVSSGDLLIAMTGATIGKFTMVPKVSETILVNQRVGKFFLGEKPIAKLPFIYCTLKQPDIISEVINRGQGSAQPNISATDIMTIPCVIPNTDEIDQFNRELSPMFEMIINNQYENTILSNTRDAILPKLMSGELDVSDLDL